MEGLKTILDIIGYISTAIVVVSFFWGLWAWFKGIIPALIGLGTGLAKRKIAIFAKGDNLTSMKSLLLDTKLFRKKNIIDIVTINDLGRAESATLFLVFWHDWEENIGQLLSKKADGIPLIVYAPRELGDIPQDYMKQISERRNTTVTNFRGRLLNDIVISMITTSYD